MIKLVLIFLGLIVNGYANSSPHQTIVILTVPKSGTNLLNKALHLITGQKFKLGESYLVNKKLVHFNHLWPGNESVINDPNCLKIIFFRDPRDTLISQMFWIQNIKDWGGGLLTQDKIARFVLMPETQRIHFLIDFPEESIGISYFYKTFSEWLSQPLVKAFCFEDLVGEEGGGSQIRQEETLRELAQYFGINLTSESITDIASQLFGGTATFRKGKIGEWKKYFTDEHKLLFKERMGNYLIGLGYEKDNQW